MELELRSQFEEIRVAGTEEEPVLTGYAAVFNERSRPLPFIERIRPGAFRRSLENGQNDILALVDHDPGKVIARQSNGTLTLREDARGLLVEIRPNMDTSFGRDIVASVKRRDITGMSFGFICRKDEWVPDPAGSGQIREIIEADLREVSIVSMPAYPQTTIQKRKEVTIMKLEEREIRQKLAEAREKHEALLQKEELTDEERAQQLELAREIRNLESQLTAFKQDSKPAAAAVVLNPGRDEQRAAFAAYLRGQEYDVRALKSSDATAGGVLAPEGFEAEVIKQLTEQTVMRRLARVIGPIDNRSTKIPRNLTGVEAYWTDEAAAITPSEPTFDQLELVPYKLAALTTVSNELLSDSGVDIEAFLARLFAEKLAAVEDAAFFNGDGVKKPRGILTYTGANGIARVTTAAASTITADEVISLYDALPPAYRANAAWVMHPNTMSYLRQLKDGQGRYLLVSALMGDAPDNILGRPVLLSSNMPTMAAGADVIIFADFQRAYFICDRRGLDVQRSTDRYFEQDLTAFRAIKRVDGQLALADAARILKMAAA